MSSIFWFVCAPSSEVLYTGLHSCSTTNLIIHVPTGAIVMVLLCHSSECGCFVCFA